MSDTKICKVARYVRNPHDGKVVGLLMEFNRVGGGKKNKGLAVLINNDFYVCGVCVLNADLSVFLKLGDSLSCQLRPLTNGDSDLLGPILAQVKDLKISFVADLGMVGPNRPTQANLAPAHAPMLDKYLASVGISLEEFERMRYNAPKPVEQMPQGFLHLMRLPMMPRPFGPVPFGIRPVGPVPIMVPGQMAPRPGVMVPVAPTKPESVALPPPNSAFPGVFGPFIPQVPVPVINLATNIAARAVNIESDDMRIRNLLHSVSEMEVAAKIAKNLTQSLIHKVSQ